MLVFKIVGIVLDDIVLLYHLKLFADHQKPETVHAVTDDFISSAQTKGEPVTTEASISGQADIGGGVIRVRVDCIRAVTLQ